MERVSLNTIVQGVGCQLDFIVVPACVTGDQIIIGDPLRDHATITLGKTGTAVAPHNINAISHGDKEIEAALKDVPEDYYEETRAQVLRYKPSARRPTQVKMKITLMDETPISRQYAALPPREKREVDAQVNEWLQGGIIVESTFDFSSWVVVSRKKDGRARMCINYKPLNKVLVRERTRMSLIMDCLDSITNGKVLCAIDLKDGYFHVEVETGSRKYTISVMYCDTCV